MHWSVLSLIPASYLRCANEMVFDCNSSSLNTEIKYAAWKKLETGQWSGKAAWRTYFFGIRWLIKCINDTTPFTSSLMEKSLEAWKIIFRSYIVKQGNYRPYK